MCNRILHCANFILLASAAIVLAFLLYSFMEKPAFLQGYLPIFYLLSLIVLSFLCTIILKAGQDIKVKTVLLVFSIIFSTYMIELVLSLMHDDTLLRSNRAHVAQLLDVPFDPRSKYQAMLDFQSAGIEAYAFHNSTQYMYFDNSELMPLGFISEKTVIYCNESGEFMIYKSDEHGFNNPTGLYDNTAIDYVLIGDSFALGNCVKREDNIAGRLTGSGNKVLNLGMGNTGPLYQLAILKEFGQPLRPGSVLWFFYEGNDHEGIQHEKRSSILMSYLTEGFSQHLMERQSRADTLIIDALRNYLDPVTTKRGRNLQGPETESPDTSVWKKLLLFSTLSEIRGRLGLAGRCTIPVEPLFEDIMTETARVIDSWGGDLFFVYLPAWERYQEKPNYCRKRFLTQGKQHVSALIREMKIPFIDIERVFSSHPDPLSLFPFRIKGHYNAEGYGLVTTTVERYLTQNQ